MFGRLSRAYRSNDWNFGFGYYLACDEPFDPELTAEGLSRVEFEYWDFRSVFTEINYFHLSRLESTLTLPWAAGSFNLTFNNGSTI